MTAAASRPSSAEERFYKELARKTKVEADLCEHQWRSHLASQDEARIYTFTAPVQRDTAAYAIGTLGQWFREDPNKPIEVVFNSPGGSVIDGLALFDYIQELRAHGATINTATLGHAASMAGVLLQAGEKRIVGRHSYILIHEISSGAIGNINKLEDEVELCKRFQARLLDILAERSTMTARQIKTKWKRKDWWLDAEQSLELGFCDEIR